jgi:hypothetical protein
MVIANLFFLKDLEEWVLDPDMRGVLSAIGVSVQIILRDGLRRRDLAGKGSGVFLS